MSQRERDVLKVMGLVIQGERTQVEAARLLGRSERQVRRLLRRMQVEGDSAVIHKLRGRASNRKTDRVTRQKVIELCRTTYCGFGPTQASEKLSEIDKIRVCPETLRGWLLSEGLWQRQRQRDKHRQRRMRRSCFGEMVQADASEHAWLEDRGPVLTLVGMIDDATDRVVLRFVQSETTQSYMDVLRRWIRKFGRPVSWYSDRHSIFRAEQKVSGYDEKQSVPTQFSRALCELGIELILANSPQAKGRIERLWGTAQKRLVNELRLAKARTIDDANVVLEKFVAWFNRNCNQKPASINDAHRPIDGLDVDGILCVQEKRAVMNDYTFRFANRIYQLHPPAQPGLRGGQVILEQRSEGTMKVRFKKKYLPFSEVDSEQVAILGLCPKPRSLAHGLIPVSKASKSNLKANDPMKSSTGPLTVHQADLRSGCTPAEPCLQVGKSCGRSKHAWRPAANHPWR